MRHSSSLPHRLAVSCLFEQAQILTDTRLTQIFHSCLLWMAVHLSCEYFFLNGMFGEFLLHIIYYSLYLLFILSILFCKQKNEASLTAPPWSVAFRGKD